MYYTFGNYFKVKLGKTKFSDLPEHPYYVDGCVGAHSWYYFETHYLGNPSNYQFYAFGYNMGGLENNNEKLVDELNEVSEIYCKYSKAQIDLNIETSTSSTALFKLRNDLIINTYLITVPFQGVLPNFGIDPDYNDVRISPE